MDLDWGTRTTVTIPIGTLDVRVAGPETGEPVILLHGFPETSLSWAAVAPALVDAGYRVIAPDQRGYSPGARPDGTEQYATRAIAQDVVDLADALGLDTFHLVGHDWGSAAAWVTAADHGHRLRTLTAVSVPHLAAFNRALREDQDQREGSSYFELFRTEGKAERVLLEDDARRLRTFYEGKIPDEAVEEYVRILSEPGALTAALSWYRAMGRDLVDLPSVTMPTTFVWSTADHALRRYGAELCAQYVDADYRFVEIEGVSHWIAEEAPDQLSAAILDRVRDA